MRLKI